MKPSMNAFVVAAVGVCFVVASSSADATSSNDVARTSAASPSASAPATSQPTTQAELRVRFVDELCPQKRFRYYEEWYEGRDGKNRSYKRDYVAIFHGVVTATRGVVLHNYRFLPSTMHAMLRDSPPEFLSEDNRELFCAKPKSEIRSLTTSMPSKLDDWSLEGERRLPADCWWMPVIAVRTTATCIRGKVGGDDRIIDQMGYNDSDVWFTTTSQGKVVRRVRFPAGDDPRAFGCPIYEFQIPAPTPERAASLAREFIHLYNDGLVASKRKELTTAHAEVIQVQIDMAAQADKLQRQIEDLNAQLKNCVDELKPEVLKDIETQRWLVSIDLASAKAKLQAVDRVAETASAATRTRLEDSRVLAQIEMAGLLARQNEIDALLSRQARRAQLLNELNAAQNASAETKENLQACRGAIERINRSLESWYFQPFVPIDNEIIVQPVEPLPPVPTVGPGGGAGMGGPGMMGPGMPPASCAPSTSQPAVQSGGPACSTRPARNVPSGARRPAESRQPSQRH